MSNYYLNNWNSNIALFNKTHLTDFDFTTIKQNWNTVKLVNDTNHINIHDDGNLSDKKNNQVFLCMCNKQITNRYEIYDMNNVNLTMIVGSECILKWINKPIQYCIECNELIDFNKTCKSCKKNNSYNCRVCNREINKSNKLKICGLCK